MKKSSLILTLVLLSNYLIGQNKEDYLQTVLNNLAQIKSAVYYSENSSSAPGDTLQFSTNYRYFKEYTNPDDPFIGSSYASFHSLDTGKLDYFYDGKVRGKINWNEKTVRVDSFKNNPLPFRPVATPFFQFTGSIIKYALETGDSVSISLKDLGDSILFTLLIHNEVVEFFGNNFIYSDLSNYQNQIMQSRYDVWIDKSDNLPYRMRRKMPHNTSMESCKNVKINRAHLRVFSALKYLPSGFTIESSAAGYQKEKDAINDLVGKAAPDWVLKDINNRAFALKQLKSKVVMIQFTGIGCGPCHMSIPFLKQLVTDYKDRDFEFVSIETWSKTMESVKRYQERNVLNFRFLKGDGAITKAYQVNSVPVFFILDANRVIRKVIVGYSKEKTHEEIVKIIDGLM